MKHIELSNGRSLWVSPDGYVTLNAYVNAAGIRIKSREISEGSFRIIGKTFYVHRLVAQAYLKSFRPGLVVRHIDGDPDNCAASNLRMGRAKAAKLSRSAVLKYDALKYFGVSYYPRNRLRPYHAISFDKIVSSHKTAISAAIAADAEAVKLGASDLLLNFPELQ